MYVIRVTVKATNELRWTEHHPTKERATEELRHMKENHFNPEYFDFDVSKEKRRSDDICRVSACLLHQEV